MIKQPEAKICDLCGHLLRRHIHEGINKCAHCDCSLSPAPSTSWWKRIFFWTR
jgi:ribosomal protein L37AE/L43A